MDFNATIDLIIKDLEEARIIIDDLKKYPGVPALQVELAKSKCKSAGEVIALLKTLKDDIHAVKEEPVQPLKQTPVPEVRKETVRSAKTAPPAEEKKKEKISAEITSPPVVKKEALKKATGKAFKSPIIADKFSHLSTRFNEQMGTFKSDEDVSGLLKTKSLSSLSEAIGLNDKFLFIREIFDGNQDEYTQAIARLDRVENLIDARAVIMSYTGESNENDAVKQLLDLVKRKLPSNE